MPSDYLRVVNWNARSVVSKKDELTEFLKSNCVDVAVITETHLKENSKFAIPGFQLVRQDRKTGKRGGVAILVRDGINFSRTGIDTEAIESVGIRLMLGKEELNIYAIYYPTQCHNRTAQKFKSDLLKLTDSQTKFMVCGDLNAHHEEWCADDENSNGKLVVETLRQLRNNKLSVNFPMHPTFMSGTHASYLDICLANFNVGKPFVKQKLSSDHFPVIYDVGANTCETADQQLELTPTKQTGQNYVSRLKTLLKSEDTELALEALLQAVETVVPSFVHEIEGQVRKILLKSSLTENDVKLDPTKKQFCKNDANLFEEVSLPQDQSWNLTCFIKVLQPTSESSLEEHPKPDVYKHIYEKLKKSLSKYRALLPTEALFTLRQILHKCHTLNVPTHHLFINLQHSYATIDREQLLKMVHKSYRWPQNVINLLRTTTNSMNPDSHVGLQQGNELSNLLMAIALDVAIRGANVGKSGTIFENDFQCICYADDIDLIAKDFTQLEQAYRKLKAKAAKIGLVLAKDTKYMQTRPKKGSSLTKVALDGDNFDVVKEFRFLKSTITCDNDLEKEIDHRIAIGQSIFQKALESPDKSIDMQFIYKTQIRPQLLYGHESWIITESSACWEKLKEFDCEVLRTIFGKLRARDGKSYEAKYFDLLHWIGELNIEHMIKLGRLRWAGHVMRIPEGCPAKIVLKGEPNVKRPRGRPPIQWIDCVEQDLRNVKRFTNWETVALDREQWNRLLDETKSKWMKRMERKCMYPIQAET